MDQLDVVVVTEHRDHFVRLVFAQQAVIYEYAGQLIANGFVQQNSGYRRIHPAGKSTNHMRITNLFADRVDCFFAIGAHCPVTFEAGKLNEILIKLLAVRGVMDLGVELHCIEMARSIGRNSKRSIRRSSVNLEARSQLADMVAVAHPDLFFAVCKPTVQNIERILLGHISASELGSAVTAFNFAAQLMHHHLLTIADAQNRHAILKYTFRRTRAAFAGDAIRTT